MTVSATDIANALLVSTRDGGYPESEEVLKTDLGASALQSSLQLVNEAKHRIETEIQDLDHGRLSDVDKWIARARRLQEDIERSKAVAREIVRDYEAAHDLQARVRDADAKVELLQNETAFNHAVILSLEEIWSVDKALRDAESTMNAGQLFDLAANNKQLSHRVERLTDSNAKDVNLDRLSRLHDALLEGLTAATISMVEFHKIDGRQRVTIDHGDHKSLGVSLDRLLQGLEKLNSLEVPLRMLSRRLYRKIFQPVLSRSPEGVICGIDETLHSLTMSSSNNKKTAENVLDCLRLVFVFIHTHFPTLPGSFIGTALTEELVEILIRDWLTPSIPISLSDVQQSYIVPSKVKGLADLIMSYDWPGYKALIGWTDRLPQTWLEKRRASSLDAVRSALKAPRGPNREVQRVERQNISEEHEAFPQNGVDDWNAAWTDEEPEATTASTTVANEEEEDLSGWDFDEDATNNASSAASSKEANGTVEDSTDAWEWGEDNADETREDQSRSRTERPHSVPTNGSTEDREITLTETYTITDIPDYLLDIISREVQDAEQMKNPDDATFESISASTGLLSLPRLILAMFRAVASPYYPSTLLNGNMRLYNDCVYVVEKLRDLARSASLNQLLEDCGVLEKFARSAYSREMDLQRTVLADLLDGAQGFVNCTKSPYSGECENAVGSTIDRLRAVHHEWSPILSRSALLQSIGSLLSTVIEKIVKDVEDMEDISEAESQRLTAFCGQFSALEDLFMSEHPGGSENADAETVPLTAVYVSNWLRFQYLSNILESSLVDIKYLWTEGELSLEFTADEVIELIEALFAGSIHRRNAVAEIRRSCP